MTQDFKKFLEFFLGISVLLVTFEILSHYPIDSSYWLQEDVQWITDKFSDFSPNFRFLPDFVVVFSVIRIIRFVVISY